MDPVEQALSCAHLYTFWQNHAPNVLVFPLFEERLNVLRNSLLLLPDTTAMPPNPPKTCAVPTALVATPSTR